MQYTWYFSELWNETMWLYTYLWQNTHFNVSVTNDKLQDANEFPHPPPQILSVHTHTHTHTHICTQVHTHAHTHQCPDIPGLWKDTCSYLNKIISDTTWKRATRVYSSNGCSVETTYSNPKPHISMSVWKMTNYRIPVISLSPKFFLCAYTHTHQCPDKPGLWKDTCCSLNKIKSNTTWRGVTRVYSSNCWSAEITYSNPKGYWFGFIQKVQISLCMMAEVGSIQVRILPGTPS